MDLKAKTIEEFVEEIFSQEIDSHVKNPRELKTLALDWLNNYVTQHTKEVCKVCEYN